MPWECYFQQYCHYAIWNWGGILEWISLMLWATGIYISQWCCIMELCLGHRAFQGIFCDESDISLIYSCLETDICVRSSVSAFSMLKIRKLCLAKCVFLGTQKIWDWDHPRKISELWTLERCGGFSEANKYDANWVAPVSTSTIFPQMRGYTAGLVGLVS